MNELANSDLIIGYYLVRFHGHQILEMSSEFLKNNTDDYEILNLSRIPINRNPIWVVETISEEVSLFI